MSPRPAPSAGTRRRIHDTAVRLFARYGFEGVGLQQLADEVGIHKSSLFHHYRNKRDLLEEVCEVVVRRIVDRVRPLAGDDPPAIETLLGVIDDLVELFSDEPDTARLLMQVMIAPPEADARAPISDDHPVVELFTLVYAWLDRARSAGAIRRVNVRQTVMNVIGVLLFYPAAAEQEPELVGTEPFSDKARRIRKREVRCLVRGALEHR